MHYSNTIETSFIELENKKIYLWSGLSIALEKIDIPSSYLQKFLQSPLFPPVVYKMNPA